MTMKGRRDPIPTNVISKHRHEPKRKIIMTALTLETKEMIRRRGKIGETQDEVIRKAFQVWEMCEKKHTERKEDNG